MVKPKGAPEDPHCPFRERVNKLFGEIVNEVTTMGGLLHDEDYGDPNSFGVRVKVGEFKTLARDAFREVATELVRIAESHECESHACGCLTVADAQRKHFGLPDEEVENA